MLDFAMVSGDYHKLVVDVRDRNGQPVALDTAVDIVWAVGKTIQGPALVEKRKSRGEIELVPVLTGSHTAFAVTLNAGDLTSPSDSKLRVQAWVDYLGGQPQSIGTGEITVIANVNRAP